MSIKLFPSRSTRFQTDETSPPQSRPDLAFLARPLFQRLTEVLRSVATLLHECRKMENRMTRHERSWSVPKLFFADRTAQKDWQSKQVMQATFPEPFVSLLATSFPKLIDAWNRLPDLLDDALSLLAESVDVRRMSRAVPGFQDAALAVPQAHELAGILKMPEEEIWLVIHPTARAGFRVAIEGVADVAQLHILLAEQLSGDPARGYLAGRRPHSDVLDACKLSVPTEGVLATSRFQFYRPEALRSDGTLPVGFGGSSDWYWGHETLDVVPRQNGERVLLIGEPLLPKKWEVTRRYSRIAAEAKLIDVLKPIEVENWLRTRCSAYRPSSIPMKRAA